MSATALQKKRIAVAAGVIGLLVVTYVVSQLLTANGQTQRAGSLEQVPGGRGVDPNGQIDHERKVTFHTSTDPATGRAYILAHGEADPASLERLSKGPRYTALYDRRFDPGRASTRIAGWYESHGVGPGGWPSGFGRRGCEVYGRTTRGTSFRMFFDRGSGKFVMRYELR